MRSSVAIESLLVPAFSPSSAAAPIRGQKRPRKLLLPRADRAVLLPNELVDLLKVLVAGAEVRKG
eukprot:scaffold2326_cov286-Pinguiococcus_pyrenoidosus.AAC.10